MQTFSLSLALLGLVLHFGISSTLADFPNGENCETTFSPAAKSPASKRAPSKRIEVPRSPGEFLGRNFQSPSPDGAFDPPLFELPPALENLISLAIADPVLGSQIRDRLGERRLTTADKGALLIAALGNPQLREALTDTALAELKRNSKAWIEFVNSITPGSANEPIFDIVFLGAGIHESTAQSVLRQLAPEARTLTIEATGSVASTFGRGGKGFNLNSKSRGPNRQNLRQAFGDGDLNFLPGGAVQVANFDNATNPRADSLTSAVTINRSLSKNPVLFNLRVTSEELLPNGLKRVTLSNGRSVLTRYVVNTGLGDGETKLPPISGLEAARRSSPDKVLTYYSFFGKVDSTDMPMKEFSGKRVAVIGPGDSGKAVVRWLLEGANPESYGNFGRSIPGPKEIQWFGQPSKDCEEFVKANRAYYFDIAGGFRKGFVKPQPKAFKIEILNRGPNETYLLTDQTGATTEVDRVVITAGVSNDLAQVLKPLFADLPSDGKVSVTDPSQFKPVRGFEPTIGEVTFALEAKQANGNDTGVFLLGPAAKGIVEPQELAGGIEENEVAMANHSWRVWRFMQGLAQTIRTYGTKKAASSPPENFPSNRMEGKIGPEDSRFNQIQISPYSNNTRQNARPLQFTDGPTLVASLARVFDQTVGVQEALGQTVAPQLKVVLIFEATEVKASRSYSGNFLTVSGQPSLPNQNLKALLEAIKGDADLLNRIINWLSQRETGNPLKVTLTFNRDGMLDSTRSKAEWETSDKASKESVTLKSILGDRNERELRNALEEQENFDSGAKFRFSDLKAIADRFFNGDVRNAYLTAVTLLSPETVRDRLEWPEIETVDSTTAVKIFDFVSTYADKNRDSAFKTGAKAVGDQVGRWFGKLLGNKSPRQIPTEFPPEYPSLQEVADQFFSGDGVKANTALNEIFGIAFMSRRILRQEDYDRYGVMGVREEVIFEQNRDFDRAPRIPVKFRDEIKGASFRTLSGRANQERLANTYFGGNPNRTYNAARFVLGQDEFEIQTGGNWAKNANQREY